ncbi:MAG: hypothetical protein NVS2B17_18360 [Candidatus Velthaea sp.]
MSEPMVLQLRRFSGTPKLGDVLVFSETERFVAHRFIAKTSDGMIVLAGDALPGAYDIVEPERVVGMVKAVWSGPEHDARRVDGAVYQLRGLLVACRRALRVRMRRLQRTSAFALHRLNPRHRPRAYFALFHAMAAILQTDAEALRRHVTSVDPKLLLVVATRHRCGPVLIDGLETLGVAEAVPADIMHALRKERWSTAARTRALKAQVDRLIGICGEIGVVPILLKGAARLYTQERDSDRHDSDDIDILLPRDRIASVTAALHAAGYRERHGTIELYEPAHHTAPLFPRTAGVPIELHHALAPPGAVRVRTDLASLAGRIRLVEGPNGRVGLLDDFASALHSAVHAREPTPLRNLIVLAYQLRRLTALDRAELYAVANREGSERNRIHAALYGASRLAGLVSPATRAGRRHFGWRLRRFDLPLALSTRSDAIEWFLGTSGREIGRVLRAFLPWEGDGARSMPQPRRALVYAMKFAFKPAVVAFTACYAALMPEPRSEERLP